MYCNFVRSIRYAYKKTKWKNPQWKHNKSYKEIVFSTYISFLYCKGWMLVSTLSRLMSMTRRFSLLKKLAFTYEALLKHVISSSFVGLSICIHISGKFKGKARRTNLLYFRNGSNFSFKTFDKTIHDYSAADALTNTGSFGIKL